jgi:hypothetical protein
MKNCRLHSSGYNDTRGVTLTMKLQDGEGDERIPTVGTSGRRSGCADPVTKRNRQRWVELDVRRYGARKKEIGDVSSCGEARARSSKPFYRPGSGRQADKRRPAVSAALL